MTGRHGACAFLAALATIAFAGQAAAFTVPQAAYERPLGEIPAKTASGVSGRGIPLGGIGAGSFMVNQAGTFGPWEFGNGMHEERILPQAAFHVREQLDGGEATTRTLATAHPQLGKVLPGFKPLSAGDGTYAALYPFGWTTYKPFATDVSMRFWSPIVAREDERTSMPVAFFDLHLANPTDRRDTVSVMLTFPNAPAHVGTSPPSTRTGLTSRYDSDPATGVAGVTLGASDPSNTSDSQDTDWTIAARPAAGQELSYATSWNGAGDGSDVFRRFAADGTLGDGQLDGSHSAGAIAVKVTLDPGQATTIPFVLAWDFPRQVYSDQQGAMKTVWMRRYTSYFGGRETPQNTYVASSYKPHQGFAIADRELSEHDHSLSAVQGWFDRIALDDAYPVWLRRAALNELYYNSFGGSFWESGLVSNPWATDSNPFDGVPGGPRIGSRVPGTHLFFDMEAQAYDWAGSYDVDAYQTRQLDLLFPSLERDMERAWTEMIDETPNGHAPHDAGSVTTTSGAGGAAPSPYINWSGYQPTNQWLDVPMKYLLRVWQYVRMTGDESLLRYAYPSLLKSYDYVLNRIPPGEHLPVDVGIDNTYDGWAFVGTTSYVGGLWILGQEVMAAATREAMRLGVEGASQSLVDQIEAELPQSRSEYDAKLWNATNGYYEIATASPGFGDGIMADALFAQHAAEVSGLPDVVSDLGHLRTHLRNSYKFLVAPFKDDQGEHIGAVNGVNSDGTVVNDIEANEVWTGVSYFYAATQYLDGVRFDDAQMRANGLETAHAIYHQTYEHLSNGYAFDTPEAWSATNVASSRAQQYQRPRAVWELLLAIKTPAIPDPAGPAPDTAPLADVPPARGDTSLLPPTGPRRCASRRHFTIHLRRRLRSAHVFVNGRRVRVLRGRRLRSPIDLRGLPRGVVHVKVVARTRSGRRLVARRTYRTCTARAAGRKPR